nr:hypothetical protein [uncultured Psychroserpens sp.]
MMNKNIIKCIAMLMVSFFIAIPLSRINSHTYTLGVSNVYKPSILCPMDFNYDLNQGYEFNELENY